MYNANCFYRLIFVLLSERRGEFFVLFQLISNECNVSVRAAGRRAAAWARRELGRDAQTHLRRLGLTRKLYPLT